METAEKDIVLELLQKRKARLQQRCFRLAKKLEQTKRRAPEGWLRVATKQNKRKTPRYQYYLLTKTGDTQGRYLKASELSVAAAIAQRDYEEALLAEQQRELCFVERTLASYIPDNAENVFDSLHPGRKRLVKPAVMTDALFAASWLKTKYKPNPWHEAPHFQTASGIFVRSKSEMIIADLLFKAAIPFRYEYPCKLKNRALYYPDFYCLIPHTRQEFIWEHFGRMDDDDYCSHTIRKLADYQQYLSEECGLLVTFEDAGTPFTQQHAEAALKRFMHCNPPYFSL